MTYGATGWHITTKENVNKIQLLHNRASRFIYGKLSTHLLDINISSHANYMSFFDLCFFFKARVDFRVTDVVTEGRLIRGQEGSVRLIPLRARTSMYQKGFVYRCTSAWNVIPYNVKFETPSYKKCTLKNYSKNL
jgi:hypothetical protein